MRKWEFIDIIAGKNSEIEVLEKRIEILNQDIFTGDETSNTYNYGKETWKMRAERHRSEVISLEGILKTKNKRIESLEQAQINIQNNNLDKTDLLGEKIEALQDEIKHLKGLKMFYLMSEDEQGRHTIEAEDYYENNLYTVFATEKKEVFKIKTSLITTMRTKEY